MTTTQLASPPSDSDLIAASRRGDRHAFGQLVLRYQSMVAGVIYSRCGDLHRSEDLAQESFLSAWKSLSGLRDPSRLSHWLCQIARHRAADDRRGTKHDPLKLTTIIPDLPAPQSASPPDQAISAEERDLLWRTLSQIAEPYRETLILYYRQSHSTSDVAAATGVSEDLVRQRLTRGRHMLREHLADLLEHTLTRSAPTPEFALSVVALLPALSAKTLTASLATKAAAGGSKTLGASLLATLAFYLGPALGLLAGITGSVTSIRQSRPGVDRRTAVWGVVLVWTTMLLAILVLQLPPWIARHYRITGGTYVILLSLTWGTVWLAIILAVRSVVRRQQRLRRDAGLPPVASAPTQPSSRRAGQRFIAIVSVLAGMSWMAALALRAHDRPGLAVVAAEMAALAAASLAYARRHPAVNVHHFAATLHALIGLAIIANLNWRMTRWFGAFIDVPGEQIRQFLPRWGMNLFLLVILAMMIVPTLLSARDQRAAASPTST